LIATVGGVADPLLASIVEHEPDALILIASQQTLGIAARVREEFPEIHAHVLSLTDAESLSEAFALGREALRLARVWDSRAVVADITGGTKPMTAGVTLALSGQGVTFSYVGGEARDPDTGRVVSGRERVRVLEDPTERFHLREWRAFQAAWNGWRMKTAAHLLQAILRDEAGLSPAEQRFYRSLLEVVHGLDAWDRFHHRRALEALERALPVALAVAEAWRHGAKVRVLSELEEQLPFLRKLVEKEGKPTENLLKDLLANAERRAETGRYDDALARLYRAIELLAEADLYHRSGIVLKAPETWPDKVPEGYRQRATTALGLKQTLDLVFDLQLWLGLENTRAQRLRGMWNELEPLLNKRHESILAHGTRPVEPDDYRAFVEVFQRLGVEKARSWPRW